MIQQIDHIGIAVKDADEALKLYRDILGLEVLHEEIVKSENLRTVSLKIGEVLIELLQPLNEKATVHKFIEKKGEGIHHIALRTDDVQASLDEFESKGIQLIDKKPRIGAGGKKIAFLHPKSTGRVLIELSEINAI